MKTEYSLVFLTTGNTAPAEMLRIAAAAGYDCIDARTIPMGLPGEKPFDLSKDKQLFAETKRALAETGVRFDSIENARIFDGMRVADYEPCLAAAAELGVKHVLSNIWTTDVNEGTERFGELCDLAAQYGQTIDLEFVTWASVKGVQDAAQVLRTVNKKNAGMIVDTLHFQRSLVTFEELAALPDEWLYCLHICDAPGVYSRETADLAQTAREGRLYPGDGDIDIRRIAATKQWPVYGIEIPNKACWDAMGHLEHAKEALRRTKAYLGEQA